MVRPDGEEVTFEYDALGRRLSKSFGTTVTRWMWNGNVPLHQWKQRRSYSREEDAWLTEEERKERTLWLFEEESFVPAAMIKEGRAYSILTDHLGTPTEAYNAEGNEVWSRTLDMNGEVIEESGNIGMMPFLFQGQYYDRETGLAYNRFRYYSPQMGMYVSQDPIRLNGGIELNNYVKNTTIFIDLYGLAPLIQNAPHYAGVYYIQGANGESYVGSAVNIYNRLDSSSHPIARDIIQSGNYKITFFEVDLGKANSREQINHVLRHFEQQIMDLTHPNMNQRRAESIKKRNKEAQKFYYLKLL